MENYFKRVDKSVALIVINFALVKTRKTKFSKQNIITKTKK